ncbi:hypothetical protein F2Q68_00045163 [Brassica cretica]|uniref:Uncharacterized protein n=1 Tax=Brassica cretica TaxID=69181 RepID=A0A8S9LHS1_BRACR|nr:hypothetical protein F2Q68_00045163 [Brassica cretica]
MRNVKIGIELFKEKKYHDAVRHYHEAIKMNPKDLRVRSIRQSSCVLHKTNKFFQGRHIGNKRDVKVAIKTILDVDPIEVKGDSSKSVLFNAGRVAKGLRHLDEKYCKETWEILSSVVVMQRAIMILHERGATHRGGGVEPATADLKMHDHRHLSLSPPSLSPPLEAMEKLVVVSRCGGHGACGEEATEKLVVGAEWWSWGLQREGDREVGGREKKLWSWGLRRGMEKFVRRLAQEY